MNPQYIDSMLPKNLEPSLQFLAFLMILAFIPMIVLTMTPFLRLVTVFSLVRQAIGVQQIPPTLVITGLSIILTGLLWAQFLKNLILRLWNRFLVNK